MVDYIAETDTEPKIRAWLTPEEPGWRIVIETVDQTVQFEPLRSTWEPTIHEAIAHANRYWATKPVWRDHETGEVAQIE